MQQLSLFDFPALPQPVKQPQADSPWFEYDIPDATDLVAALSKGDRVLILPAKYHHTANHPGIVKGFILDRILVRTKTGEGLYWRRELHKITG
ncbi:MAG: hypothetical protein F6K31_12960 [Symploca sp. SIO2G7]|nr:hypothetical protein [Symploca sp. SIO2G7]